MPSTLERVAKLILEKILKKKRISKAEFARRIPMKYENAFRCFQKDYNPRWSTLNDIARALGVRVRDLFKED